VSDESCPIYDIEFNQGADETIEFQYTDANDVPKDLTGYSSILQVRDRPGGKLLLDLSTMNGGLVITALLGKTGIVNSHLLNINFEWGDYDWWLISGAGTKTKHLRGKFHYIQSVSQL
jgi:hypothetical protein